MKTFTPALVAATALLSLSAWAGSDVSSAKANVQPQAFTAGLKLLKTYFETNNANGTALVSGFNPYGSTQTVNCTATAGCFIMVNANAQVAGVATVNPSAIVIKVDGATINAPFNTPVSTTSFTVMTYQTGIAVTTGTHTVTMEAYVSNPTTLHRYNTEVKLYK
ncbi:hypothetical protein [Ideonella alba]|uniref:Uncharacterized protein n=1 Tax=Ideonella alba TaxID=2824118 RepID=A0A940YBU6_9BURK|nr:hypothetical protein [Ideonella alba]MBQ0929480.1 hypothetical protein [Ideonella alba]